MDRQKTGNYISLLSRHLMVTICIGVMRLLMVSNVSVVHVILVWFLIQFKCRTSVFTIGQIQTISTSSWRSTINNLLLLLLRWSHIRISVILILRRHIIVVLTTTMVCRWWRGRRSLSWSHRYCYYNVHSLCLMKIPVQNPRHNYLSSDFLDHKGFDAHCTDWIGSVNYCFGLPHDSRQHTLLS